MTPSRESLGQDLKAWAADQLHVSAGSSPEEVRAAYLRRVQHNNGGPNLSAREALLILTGRASAARPALALEAAEEKLHGEVEAFADRFFAFPIAERKAQWDRLWARGQGLVRVAARLTALQPGIYIIVPHLDRNSPLGQLTWAACKSFVLRAAARAAYRRAFLDDADRQRQWQAWKQAALYLRSNHRALAASRRSCLRFSPIRRSRRPKRNAPIKKCARPRTRLRRRGERRPTGWYQ
jgi:hypothetical protein